MPDPPRTGSGYRIYDDSALSRLKFIGQAQALGLALDEIAEILEIADEGVQPCGHVRSRLQQRLVEVEARLGELRRLRARLRAALVRAEAAPAPTGCRCGIIEAGSARQSTARAGQTDALPG